MLKVAFSGSSYFALNSREICYARYYILFFINTDLSDKMHDYEFITFIAVSKILIQFHP